VDEQDWREEFRPDIPSPARVYNYLLSGKDHYPADREVAENLLSEVPTARIAAQQNRAFLGRVCRFLAAEAGVRQFLDIGSGLPSQGQVHEIVQAIAPDARVAYVDNDPVVLAHGRSMLHGVDNAAFLCQDLREPDAILADPELVRLFDFDRPIALLIVAVLHFIDPEDKPHDIVARLMSALPSGSYLAISHLTADDDPSLPGAFERQYKTTSNAIARSRKEILAFFDDLDLVAPGITWVPLWRPDPDTGHQDNPASSLLYGAIGRKP
jgi:S-adenosyl methyltransferase